MTEDEERAKQIRMLAKALNQQLYDAHVAGLKVDVSIERQHFVGLPYPLQYISVAIYREIVKAL